MMTERFGHHPGLKPSLGLIRGFRDGTVPNPKEIVMSGEMILELSALTLWGYAVYALLRQTAQFAYQDVPHDTITRIEAHAHPH